METGLTRINVSASPPVAIHLTSFSPSSLIRPATEPIKPLAVARHPHGFHSVLGLELALAVELHGLTLVMLRLGLLGRGRTVGRQRP